jgi:hypothetical protein
MGGVDFIGAILMAQLGAASAEGAIKLESWHGVEDKRRWNRPH